MMNSLVMKNMIKIIALILFIFTGEIIRFIYGCPCMRQSLVPTTKARLTILVCSHDMLSLVGNGKALQDSHMHAYTALKFSHRGIRTLIVEVLKVYLPAFKRADFYHTCLYLHAQNVKN